MASQRPGHNPEGAGRDLEEALAAVRAVFWLYVVTIVTGLAFAVSAPGQ